MIRTSVGHIGVKVRGDEYLVIPSLINISKIGTPKEIVEAFAHIDNPARFKYDNGVPVGMSFSYGFGVAAWILQCCGLPETVTGWTRLSSTEKGLPYWSPVEGKIGFHDVFVLAAHCLKHGVCGEISEDNTGDPMEEFDAYYYIALAHEAFGITMSEARELTMTEFSLLANAKKEVGSEKRVKKHEAKVQRDSFDWFKNRKKAQ